MSEEIEQQGHIMRSFTQSIFRHSFKHRIFTNRISRPAACRPALAMFPVAALVAACGGGGGGGGGSSSAAPTATTTPVPAAYQQLSSAAATTSTLGGTALQRNNSTGASAIVTVTGALTHNTGAAVLSDGAVTLTDADGADANGVLTDGASSATVNAAVGFTGTYEYVTPYTQSYTAGGTSFDTAGFIGVVTRAADMPTSGSATWQGESQAVVLTATQGLDLAGTATVSANFSAGTVDVTMTGFAATSQATGAAAASPVDTIAASGMAISGNGFSGGTIATIAAGTAVNVAGANASAAAGGAFFGLDAAGNPDEVAGVVSLRGDSGQVSAAFVAD